MLCIFYACRKGNAVLRSQSQPGKMLLYAINGGMDERLKVQVGPRYRPVETEYLDYDDVMQKF